MKIFPILLVLLTTSAFGMEATPDPINPASHSLHHIGLCAHFIPNNILKREETITEKFKDVVLDIFLDVAQDKKNQGAEPKFTRDLLAGKLFAEAELDYRDKADAYRKEYRDTALRDDDVHSLAWNDHFCESALYIVLNYPFDRDEDEEGESLESEEVVEQETLAVNTSLKEDDSNTEPKAVSEESNTKAEEATLEETQETEEDIGVLLQ